MHLSYWSDWSQSTVFEQDSCVHSSSTKLDVNHKALFTPCESDIALRILNIVILSKVLVGEANYNIVVLLRNDIAFALLLCEHSLIFFYIE